MCDKMSIKTKFNEIFYWLWPILFVILILFVFIYPLIHHEYRLYSNYKEYGSRMSDSEVECYMFCDPQEYYFSGGGLFSGDTCVCK